MFTVQSNQSRNMGGSLSPNKNAVFANMTAEELRELMNKIKSDRKQHIEKL